MSKNSSIHNLPTATRDSLIKRLRDANYGMIDKHLAWLHDQGHTDVSRSAMGRFAVRLSSVEASNGVLAAQIKSLGRRPSKLKKTPAHRAVEISKRLEELATEQSALIKEFMQMASYAAGAHVPPAKKLA